MWPRQRDGVTCGPSVAVMAGALLDAEYGAALRGARPQQWFDAEQGRVHRAVNRFWPRALGTTPAETLVLEDSYNGVRAGAAGHFVTVMVPDMAPADDEMRRLYTAECRDLYEVLEGLQKGRF